MPSPIVNACNLWKYPASAHRHARLIGLAKLFQGRNSRIPSITAAQLALVEPYLDAGRTQALADPFSGLGVFGRIAEEDGSLAASG